MCVMCACVHVTVRVRDVRMVCDVRVDCVVCVDCVVSVHGVSMAESDVRGMFDVRSCLCAKCCKPPRRVPTDGGRAYPGCAAAVRIGGSKVPVDNGVYIIQVIHINILLQYNCSSHKLNFNCSSCAILYKL